MRRVLIPIFIAICILPAISFGQNSEVKQARVMSPERAVNYSQQNSVPIQTIKIENGKVWVNGNLTQDADLPSSLRKITPSFAFQATLQGGNEFKFALMGAEYLVKSGRIVEMTPPANYEPVEESVFHDNGTSRNEYYNSMKQESPVLFNRLSQEAELHENSIRLTLDYQMAPAGKRDGIREELRLVLGKLFDLNIANMESEMSQMEQQLQTIKANIEYKKKHRTQIIETRLNELTY